MTSLILNRIKQTIPILGMALTLLFSILACESAEESTPLLMTIDFMEYESEGRYIITGTIASMGDQEISSLGVCWGESENPDNEGCSLELEPPFSTGKFTVSVSGLAASTCFYFRAYAVLNSTTVYSEIKEFTTRPSAENMLMDADGNIYKTVKIGDQTWMAENLKATMYADKTPIPLVEDDVEWFDFTRESLGFCWYENVLTHGYAYGGLYTWAAATRAFEGISTIEEGVQGVCPDGWHLPSDDEWKQLEMHLGMSQADADAEDWRGFDQGGKLKQEGNTYWDEPNSGATDEHGFNALPTGFRHGSAEFMNLYQSTRMWTSTQNGYGYAWYRELSFDRASVYRNYFGVYNGYSVRCVKDQ